MKIRQIVLITSLLASAGFAAAGDVPEVRAQADSRINVRFVEPEKFTDLRESWSGSSESLQKHVLGELRAYLRKRGEGALREDLHLNIWVTDIDLAGDFEPGRTPPADDIRIIRAIYPVRIKLQFQLSDSTGTVLAEGERTLSDFGRINDPFPKSDLLRYEKEVLRAWLNKEFRTWRKE